MLFRDHGATVPTAASWCRSRKRDCWILSLETSLSPVGQRWLVCDNANNNTVTQMGCISWKTNLLAVTSTSLSVSCKFMTFKFHFVSALENVAPWVNKTRYTVEQGSFLMLMFESSCLLNTQAWHARLLKCTKHPSLTLLHVYFFSLFTSMLSAKNVYFTVL